MSERAESLTFRAVSIRDDRVEYYDTGRGPAILIESGFLTNRSDARLLRSDKYLDTLAAQIAAGLGHYRNGRRNDTSMADTPTAKLPPVGARH